MKRYCCNCGRKLVNKTLLDGSREKYCQDCDQVFFEEPSPGVIVAVLNADRIVLTRSVGWKHSHWGLVAGHIKSGETAEEAAVREVGEEVGLDVVSLDIIGTFASKPRNLLMLGFKASTNGTSIKISQELERAEWFRVHEPLPLGPGSIAHRVVAKICPDVKLALS